MEENRFIQRNKKEILRRDTLRISVAVQRCTVKKVSLKILPPVYLHIIKIDIKQQVKTSLNLSNPDISDQIYKPSQQKPFHVMFLIKKRSANAQYFITNFIIISYVSKEAAICRCSSKKVFLKILQYSQENTSVGFSF